MRTFTEFSWIALARYATRPDESPECVALYDEPLIEMYRFYLTRGAN